MMALGFVIPAVGEGGGSSGWEGSSPVPFTHQKPLQKRTGGDSSAPQQPPDFKPLQFLSRQHHSGSPRVSLASGPAEHERGASHTWRGGPSKMCRLTRDMAVRMLHMTQFLRKKGPIAVRSLSPPLPQHRFFLRSRVEASGFNRALLRAAPALCEAALLITSS